MLLSTCLPHVHSFYFQRELRIRSDLPKKEAMGMKRLQQKGERRALGNKNLNVETKRRSSNG